MIENNINILPIRQRSLDDLRNLINKWKKTSNLINHDKSLLIITGDPGVGKSYLTFRLIKDLLGEIDVYKIIGPQISNYFDPDKFKETRMIDGKNNNQELNSIFILDDAWISIGKKITRAITIETIRDIIKG